MRRYIGALLLTVGLLTLTAGVGRAVTLTTYTLQDLIDGQGFPTVNGLAFSEFNAIFTGNQPESLASVLQVGVLDDGFRIIGPMSAADGALGDIFISYSVAVDAESGQLISGASLLSNVAANGLGAQAAIDELFNGDDLLSNVKTGGSSDGIYLGSVLFDTPAERLNVTKDILLDSGTLEEGFGGSARISLIQQQFTVVPEPATLGMVFIGLTGLALARRRFLF